MDAELDELARPRQHAAFERADRPVVILDTACELPADAVHVADERRQPAVQVLGQHAYLFRVLGQRQLPPAVGYSLQRREDDLFRQGEFDQVGLFIERRAQELVAGNEQDDELGTFVELLPVGFAGQHANVVADIPRMPLQAELALVVVLRFDGLEVGVQRRLDVDNELPLIRHSHDQVGPEHAVLAARMDLLLEVAMLDHAGQLDEPP